MPRYTTAQLADALRKNRGMVYVAAAALGCDADTIKKRMAKSPALRAVKEEEEGKLLDIGESKLAEGVEAGDVGLIKFLLSTKGKSRGYVERKEVSGENGGEILLRVVYGDDSS